MDDRWFSVDEIAEYLGVVKDTISTHGWLQKACRDTRSAAPGNSSGKT
jgi:hypothetical protein